MTRDKSSGMENAEGQVAGSEVRGSDVGILIVVV